MPMHNCAIKIEFTLHADRVLRICETISQYMVFVISYPSRVRRNTKSAARNIQAFFFCIKRRRWCTGAYNFERIKYIKWLQQFYGLKFLPNWSHVGGLMKWKRKSEMTDHFTSLNNTMATTSRVVSLALILYMRLSEWCMCVYVMHLEHGMERGTFRHNCVLVARAKCFYKIKFHTPLEFCTHSSRLWTEPKMIRRTLCATGIRKNTHTSRQGWSVNRLLFLTDCCLQRRIRTKNDQRLWFI